MDNAKKFLLLLAHATHGEEWLISRENLQLTFMLKVSVFIRFVDMNMTAKNQFSVPWIFKDKRTINL
ncbi:CLUMA_CG006608, isoform A [Clunio marinus]|uniref:CLUMA_CG006608, isoform A n=1 Tax=Clunio marinus TaxID=568069 RepID=A0A1J1HYW2_9DIPT|nr:CLUMA_CG006608, isoform A [Clunio marinus]